MLEVELHKQLGNTELAFAFNTPALKSVVFGPSGCGKSTLLKMLAGLTAPDWGMVSLQQQCIFDSSRNVCVPAHRRCFGYLPQKSCLFPHMDVAQNISYGLRCCKSAGVATAVAFWADRLGITQLLQRFPAQLSGGQQQRVALARVFASNPQLLLLDEPFSALDLGMREEMRDLLGTLVDEAQIPAILVTHDREEAYVFGEHLIVMQEGRVLESGSLQDIYQAPACVETAIMLGFDNRWQVEGVDGDEVQLCNGWCLHCTGDLPANVSQLCIRPEDVMILRPDRPLRRSLSANVISVTLRSIHARGRHYKLVVEDAKHEYLSIHIPEHAFRVMNLCQGQQLNVSLKSQALVGCTWHSNGKV